MSDNDIEIKDIIPKIHSNVHFIQTDDLDFIIELTDSNYKVRIKKELYIFLKQIDGNHTLGELTKSYNYSNNFNLSVDYFYNILVQNLNAFRFIEESNEQAKPSRDYLHLRAILINEKTVDKIVNYTKILFNKYVFIFLLASSFIFICVHNVFNYNIINDSIKNMHGKFLFVLLSFIIVDVIIHELGHASACKFFGSRQKGIGFGFYIFSPVFFTDVSDIWKLNKKRRIIVNLGGIYFELILNAIILIVYYITGFKILLILPAFVLTKLIIDLNPFFRYDGYWILSDLTEVPNLRKQSYRTINEFFINRSVLNFTSRDYFLLFYGIISILIIGAFIVFITIIHPTLILEGWKHIYKLIVNIIFSNAISYSIEDIFFRIFIPLVFYIMVIKYLISLVKFKK
ncbi:MAG: hypothetical protein EHM93_11685 [Bacteroidales bacterium]|nr:MAG: hypothetical protein EHM93_11685 [Bacteroidales bacterium]